MINAYISDPCKDTDKGAKDSDDDGCDVFQKNRNWCGMSDVKNVFTSKTMCCACGGGKTGSKLRRLINLLSISM